MRRWAWESPDGSEGRKPRRGGQQCTARFVGASGHVLTVARRHKRCRFDPWVGKIPWRRAWQPTPVFLPGEFHGQRSLAGYGPQGRKESYMTEATYHACNKNRNKGEITSPIFGNKIFTIVYWVQLGIQ